VENVDMTAPIRSWICNASLISGAVLAIGVFGLSAPNAHIEGVGDAAFGVAIPCWVGLPLILLGLIKIFRFFPNTQAVLWGVGCFALFGSCWSVFFAAKGSTTAVALIFIPLYVLAGYGIVALVLLWRRGHSQ
jgi:hypothetical protein